MEQSPTGDKIDRMYSHVPKSCGSAFRSDGTNIVLQLRTRKKDNIYHTRLRLGLGSLNPNLFRASAPMNIHVVNYEYVYLSPSNCKILLFLMSSICSTKRGAGEVANDCHRGLQ